MFVPIFPYNIIENSQNSFFHNSVLLVQITSNLVQRHAVQSDRPYQNFGQLIMICIVVFLMTSHASYQYNRAE